MKLFDSPSRKATINLTALIDILFLLIIFFAVSTRFTDQHAIGLDLPNSQSSSTVSTAKRLVLIVKEEDQVLLNGKQMSFDEVATEIRQKSYDRSQKVVLNIDKKIVHGKVIQLLDILKVNGFSKVAFGTYGRS